MAKMIPSHIHAGCISKGEKEIFTRLKNDMETDDWAVLHSLDIAHHRKQISGEIDFVIIIPFKGVLCVEVKACSKVRRDAGNWFYGSEHSPDARGPFKQASEAMHSLRSRLVERRPDLSRVVFWSAVIFPYLSFPLKSDEWHPWQVIDLQGFRASPLSKLFEAVLDNARNFLESCPSASWFYPESQEPYPDQCAAIADTLRLDFEFLESPKSRTRRRDEEIRQYTEEQFIALDAMETNPRVAFTGPAGAGKTLLAIESARRNQESKRKTLLLCYNRLLGKWLESQVSDLCPIATARTIHSHMLNIAGVKPIDRQDFWEGQLPSLAIEKILDDPREDNLFDELLIDEAQDMLSNTYLDFLDLSLKGGLAAGRWRLFGDFEKQSIYGATNLSLDSFLETRGGHAPKYSLRINCRNTPRIALFTYLLGGLDPSYSRVLRSDDEIEPEIIFYSSQEDQQLILVETLGRLYDEGFHGSDIAILSMKGAGSCAGHLNEEPWRSRLHPMDLTQRMGIGFCSIHSFKGLEAPAIVVTDIDRVAGLYEQSLFYIAITRALQRLIIIMQDTAKVEIANAIREIANRNMQGG